MLTSSNYSVTFSFVQFLSDVFVTSLTGLRLNRDARDLNPKLPHTTRCCAPPDAAQFLRAHHQLSNQDNDQAFNSVICSFLKKN